MSEHLWRHVAERMAEHSYMAGIERTAARVRSNGEVFTPTALVLEMMQYFDIDLLAPGKTVLDPACGDGQFLVAAKWIKVLHHGMSEVDALADIYGVDIMRDNVDLCKRRLGGGTIVMGDSLAPSRRIEGQTLEEHQLMLTLYDEPGTRTRKKPRLSGRKSSARHSLTGGRASQSVRDSQGDVEALTLFSSLQAES